MTVLFVQLSKIVTMFRETLQKSGEVTAFVYDSVVSCAFVHVAERDSIPPVPIMQ